MKTTRLILANLLLFSLQGLSAQPPTWLCQAPGRKEFPSAGALVLRHVTRLTLLPGGRTSKHVLLAVKVLRLPPVENSGIFDPRIHFDPSRQELKILQARTWLPSGQAMDTGKNGKNLVFPDALNLCPDFSRFRDMVVTHVGVREGCTIVLEYELTDKSPSGLPFEGLVDAQFPFPLLHQEFILEVPAGTPLQAELLAPPQRRGEKTVEKTADRVRIRILREGVIPRAARPADVLVFGTRPWEELERKFRAGLARLGPLPGMFLEILKKETSKAATPLEKADRAARLVRGGLREIHWPARLLGWTVRPAGQIWKSAYAAPLEEAAFLAGALRAAGFPGARVVPVTRLENLQVPCLEAAREFWVSAAGPEGRPIWIRAGGTPGDPPPAALTGASSLLGPPIPSGAFGGRGRVAVKGRLSILPGGRIAGTLEVTLEGTAFNGTEASLKGLGPAAKRLARLFGGARPGDITVLALEGSRALFRMNLEGGKALPDRAGLFHLVLPLLPGSPPSVLTGLALPRNPSTTLLPGGPWKSDLDLEITLPGGARIFALPPGEKALQPPLGSWEREVRVSGRKVRIHRSLEVKVRRVEPARWGALRSLLAPLRNETARTLLWAPGE